MKRHLNSFAVACYSIRVKKGATAQHLVKEESIHFVAYRAVHYHRNKTALIYHYINVEFVHSP